MAAGHVPAAIGPSLDVTPCAQWPIHSLTRKAMS